MTESLSMTLWALLRFVKFVSVALLTVAIVGGVFAPDARMRRRLGQHLGTLALMGVMLALRVVGQRREDAGPGASADAAAG